MRNLLRPFIRRQLRVLQPVSSKFFVLIVGQTSVMAKDTLHDDDEPIQCTCGGKARARKIRNRSY